MAHSIASDARQTIAPDWGSTATQSVAQLPPPMIQVHTSPWSPDTDGRHDKNKCKTKTLVTLKFLKKNQIVFI